MPKSQKPRKKYNPGRARFNAQKAGLQRQMKELKAQGEDAHVVTKISLRGALANDSKEFNEQEMNEAARFLMSTTDEKYVKEVQGDTLVVGYASDKGTSEDW